MKTMRSSLLAPMMTLLLFAAVSKGQMRAPTAPEDHTHAKAAVSTSVTVSVTGKQTTFTVSQLQALPQKTVSVHNSHLNSDQVYTGPLLTDVLAKAGADGSSLGKALLHSYVKAGGTDGYWVLYSGTEIDAASHSGDVIVATTLDGKPLGDNGLITLVSSQDSKPQRWVRNLASITLVKAE